MTAVKQVKRAVAAAIAAAGGAAEESYSAEKFKMSESAVTAVGVRETVIEPGGGLEYLGRRTDEGTQGVREVYGRRMALKLSMDVFAPRALGADGCEEAAERVMQALMTALPEGLKLRELHLGQTEWDKVTGMFRLRASAAYEAYFLCEMVEDETVFTDFVLKGTVKEREQYDP